MFALDPTPDSGFAYVAEKETSIFWGIHQVAGYFILIIVLPVSHFLPPDHTVLLFLIIMFAFFTLNLRISRCLLFKTFLDKDQAGNVELFKVHSRCWCCWGFQQKFTDSYRAERGASKPKSSLQAKDFQVHQTSFMYSPVSNQKLIKLREILSPKVR